MTCSGGLRCGDERHAQLVSALGQLAQDAFAVALLVIVLTLIGVFLALGKHRVDQPRELVGRSGYGLGLIHARAHAPEVGAQCRLAGAQSRCGQTHGLGRPIGTSLGLTAH